MLPDIRIGHGFDAHRFDTSASPPPLVLGGVVIPFEWSLKAHSDGDVVVHALCDALLGAAGKGDIGRHFPDSSADYAGIDSRILLRRVVDLLAVEGLAPSNADLTIVAQAPRLAPHIDAMRTCVAADLNLDPARVNVKATTTEKMGFTGRKEGIAAHAVVLLVSTSGTIPEA